MYNLSLVIWNYGSLYKHPTFSSRMRTNHVKVASYILIRPPESRLGHLRRLPLAFPTQPVKQEHKSSQPRNPSFKTSRNLAVGMRLHKYTGFVTPKIHLRRTHGWTVGYARLRVREWQKVPDRAVSAP